MEHHLTIADLRAEMGLTQTEFAIKLGLSAGGKPTVSLWETGAREVSFAAALKIEELSDGRIDAATLNAQVALARSSSGTTEHDGLATPGRRVASTVKGARDSSGAAERGRSAA